ncbi:hypothetical protein CAAU_1962 [Caloramator australicus RC3]|uniref:Uncharacterized protein n=1 Tax=Caloramator australicus RC3 TaxID=857293 RepID=I7LHH7_9CLOT|nr:hypothetical protein CAAU_1962 [Caloramator australicus RC3]
MKKNAASKSNKVREIIKGQYEELEIKVNSLIENVYELYGTENVNAVLKEENLLDALLSDELNEKLFVLQKVLLNKDDFIDDPFELIEKLEEKLAYVLARKKVEMELEKKVDEIIEKNNEKFIDDIKLSIIKNKGDQKTAKP